MTLDFLGIPLYNIKKKVNAKRWGRKPLTPLFYQMKRGKAMVSAIAIFIIVVNVYIYLKNKKDK